MKIQVNCQFIEVPENFSAVSVAEFLHLDALAVSINGVFADIGTTLQEGDVVKFFSFDTPEGKNVFWHTSAHVLAQAVLRLWPEAIPTIGPPIENGFYYDFANLAISDEDFDKIENEVQKIIKENFFCKKSVFPDKKKALERFSENCYKIELIHGFEQGEISAYQQGEFFDLCRGPHLSRIGKIKAFKILKTSGAYWKGDQNREMLTRIYAISYPNKKLLQEYLFLLEEAKKRDHKILGPKLDLFSLKEEAPGIPFIHPRGMVIWDALIDFLKGLLKKRGYVEIKTPHLMGCDLWKRSGHWSHYRENMYAFEVENRWFAIKPMSCPGCMLYYKSKTHSYRSLPLRIAEIGLVHRHEASGALSGLFRVRSFHQDDAHLFMRPCDIKQEILGILALVEEIYKTFGLEYRLELSTRPEKSIGSDEEWGLATKGLEDALQDLGRPFRINEGDGAFYGPKIDIHIQDALKRSWQCGTIQLDMSLPEKFDLEYVDSDGVLKRPVMLHRAIFGSIERFFGILIEHFAGKFPLWISPLPIRIIPIAPSHLEYSYQIMKSIEEEGFICDIDLSEESISKKIRNAQILQINYMLTIGDKETSNKTINIRTRDNVVHGEESLLSFLKVLKQEMREKSLETLYAHHSSK